MEFRKYKVGDLFDTKTCKKSVRKNNDKLGYMSICTGTNNNGVNGTDSEYTENGNVITLETLAAGACFYQPNNFFVGKTIDHLNKVTIKNRTLTENIALYLCTVFNDNMKIYNYQNKRSAKKFLSEIISLPSIIHPDGTSEPDWEYIESYIANLRSKIDEETRTEIDVIENVKKHRNKKVDVSEWKEYKMNKIFDISGLKGNKILSNNDVTEKDSIHNIASLGATDENNQIQGYVQSSIFEVGNFISCNVFTGKCFYQKENCIAGSHGLTKVKIKNKILNENISLFLIPLLNKLSNLYNRQHQRSGSVMKNETIKLPSIIHDDGTFEPDWNYIENYIKELKGEKYEKLI